MSTPITTQENCDEDPDVIAWATAYVQAGISITPLQANGTKRSMGAWKQQQLEIIPLVRVRLLFQKGFAIGMVCGRVSGGLEVLDFDKRPEESMQRWRAMLPPELFNRLTICRTGGGGYHVLYRCNVISPSQKIARTAEKEVLIESRGEGAYIVAVGSPRSTHSSGRFYVQIQGEPLPKLPVITEDERAVLWRAAATLNELVDNHDEAVSRRARELRPVVSEEIDQSKPWHDFDVRGDWGQILRPHGWTSIDGEFWTRPGKSGGSSSAHVVVAEAGIEILTVFSTNADKLAPQDGGHRNWSKFGAYAELNFGGDRREAAREARRMGFGQGGNVHE